MKLHKKGFAPALFKWIFAVIAGALILVFLMSFVFKQQGTADTLDERKLVIGLEHQLEALATTDVASKTLPLKRETTLNFDCDGIASKTYRKSTGKVLFAAPQLKGNILHTWVRQWEFPFRAGTFYYVTNKNIRTLLIFDTTTLNFVRDLTIPQTFNTQLMDVSKFSATQLLGSVRGLDTFNLIFFAPLTDAEQLLQQFQGVNINLVEVNIKTKEVTITTTINTEETYYLGESMLYGLLFAPENYVCLKDKALERHKDLLGLYEQKVTLLIPKLSTQPQCQALLGEAQKLLRTYRTAQENKPLHDHAKALTQQNENLAKNDCPTIY